MTNPLRMHLIYIVSSGLKKGKKFSIKGLPGIKKLPTVGNSLGKSLLQGMQNKAWTGTDKEF